MPLTDDILKAHLATMINHYPQRVTVKGAANVACIATGYSEQITMSETGEVDQADYVFIILESAISEPISGDTWAYDNKDLEVMSVRKDPANAGYRVACKIRG